MLDMMESAHKADETEVKESNQAYDDTRLNEELRVMQDLEREMDKRRDSLSRKRAGRQIKQ